MRKLLSIFILLSFILSGTSCSNDKNEPDRIEPTPSSSIVIPSSENLTPTLPIEGGTASLSFTASDKWNVEVPNLSWLSVSPISGSAGTIQLTINVEKNDTSDDREASIDIKCGDVTKTIKVTLPYDFEAIEKAALMDIRKALNLTNKEMDGTQYLSWDMDKPLNEWFNVRLNETGHVSFLRLSDFAGELPESIGNLKFLEYLTVSGFYRMTGECRGITKVPKEIGNLSNLKELLIHDLYCDVPKEVEGLKRLEHLSVGNPHSAYLQDFSWIENLKSIQTLTLFYGGKLENMSFTGFNNLKNLVIRDFIFNNVHFETFPNLESITFETNDELLPDWISGCEKLKGLDISGDNIIALPSWIGDFSNLETLSIRCYKLSMLLPDSLRKLTGLKYLSLNGLNAIPYWVGELTNLTELDLTGTSWDMAFTEIPENIINLKKLRALQLTDLDLSSIPEWIWDFKDLERLTISNNPSLFESGFPESVCDLANLRYLDLRSNAITGSIPTSITKLNNLEELDLSYNCLSGSITPEIEDFFDAIEAKNTWIDIVRINPQKYGYGVEGTKH